MTTIPWSRGRSLAWSLMLGLACRGGGSDADDDTTTAASESSGAPVGTSSLSSSDSGEPVADSSSGTPEASTSSSGDFSTGGESSMGSSDGDTAATRDENGCPADAPDSWISCESFDAITDAPRQLSQWNVNADGFAVLPDVGVAGGSALRVRLQPGIGFGGWVTLRFGEGPAAPGVDSPRGQWDEVWLRYWLRTGADWPGRQIGDVGELIAMNGTNWGIAADLNIQGDGGMRVHPWGWSCIFGGVQTCNGTNDWSGTLQSIWNATGSNTVFDAAHADTWQCFEAHLRLNTPGASDGEAHVWVDDNLEVEMSGVDWRETWDDYGINAVRFTNYADPVDVPLDFFVDEVVVATERVGC